MEEQRQRSGDRQPGRAWAALAALLRWQGTRRVFTVVRQVRRRHPAVLACRDALRQAVTARSGRG
ncbi:hypothetical protein AB0E88_30425 [Streptomyces sp. NPDC028635]|uniref:hypothetical protein n=1 Tax=Streptomyces sp. NPDC028635 TaxID=3154800 RepID=UPI0033ECB6C3